MSERYLPNELARRITGHRTGNGFRRWALRNGVRWRRRGGSPRLLFHEGDVLAAYEGERPSERRAEGPV